MRALLVLVLVLLLGAAAEAAPSRVLCALHPFGDGCPEASFAAKRGLASCPRYVQAPPLPTPGAIPAQWQAAFDQIAAVLDSGINTVSVPAYFATIVYRDQIVWSRGAGVRDKRETPQTPPTIDNVFRVGSVSKLWPAIMMAQAYERGLIGSVDEHVDRFVSGLQLIDPFGASGPVMRSFSWRQLAAHSAGLPREAPCRFPCANITLDQMVQQLRSVVMIFPTETRPSYSNLGSALLGHALAEKVFNFSAFENATQALVQGPLQLRSTTTVLTPVIESQLAVGYMPSGVAAPLYTLGFVSPAGDFYSSGRDLATLVMDLLRGETRFPPVLPSKLFQSAETIRRLLQPAQMIPELGTDGFGTPFELLFRHGYMVRTKAGNLDGYSASIAAVPELQLGMTITYTGTVDMITSADRVLDILLPAFVAGLATFQPGAVPSPDAGKYIGVYWSAEGLGTILIRESATIPGVIEADSGGGPQPLSYSGVPGQYAITDPGEAVAVSCMVLALQASIGEYFVFDENASGVVTRLSIPGVLPGYYFDKLDIY